MLDDDIQLQPEEIIEIISELTIRYWKCLKILPVLRQQITMMSKTTSSEVEELKNKVQEIQKEKDDLVLTCNRLEEENIALRTNLAQKERTIHELRIQIDKLTSVIEDYKKKEQEYEQQINRLKEDISLLEERPKTNKKTKKS